MNVFYVDHDPAVAARMLCDKHVIKMCLESTQILCTVLKRYALKAPYKATHAKHPCVIWAGDRWQNQLWLFRHAVALFHEYSLRYGREHKTERILFFLPLDLLYGKIPNLDFVCPPQCMPDEYKQENTVEAYRAYYWGEKARFAKWEKGREKPEWFKEDEICTRVIKTEE